MIEGIEFTIGFSKQEYLLGTPMVAYIQLTNKGSKSVSISDQLSPEYDIVKFEIKKENEQFQFLPYTVLDALPHMIQLDPSKSIRGTAKLFYGARKWTFKTPSRYRIKASYKGLADEPEQVIESNEVELEIEAPTTKEEKDQVDLIMGDQQGTFLLFEGGDHLTKGVESLANLANKYPKESLAKYANFALGVSESTDFADFSKMKVRPANTEKAVSHLEACKPSVHGYWANKTYLTLADVYKKTNNKRQEKATLDEFVRKYPSDNRHKDSIKRAEGMLEDLS